MKSPPEIAAGAPVPSSAIQSVSQLESCVRQHPGGTLLLVAGLGIATVLIARALTPTPPRNRALRLLEDIREQLSTLADDGAHALGNGMGSLGDLHLDRSLDKFSRRVRAFFH